MKSPRRLLAAVLLGASGLLWAAPLTVGPATRSTLTATFKQQGVAVENPFLRWSGRIEYDPADVAAAKAEIDVEMDSYDIGDPAYAAELAKKSWFDTAAHPRGTFRSTAIKPVSATRFDATGTLTLKGRSQTITVPVTVGTSGGATTFSGSFSISRKAFGIGDPVWDGVVEDQVLIKFNLVGGR
ncbi:MAG: YceI family protein [Pseudomonadota bacterium]|jgi:polyisoprenoid-binding protein YceI|nr:MAG: polyisoprenoid-binding protein [Pseudomonadota bacterium]